MRVSQTLIISWYFF